MTTSGDPPVGIHLRAFNWQLYRERRRAGLTQAQLGLLAGLPTQTISRFEGLRQWPTEEQAQEVADALQKEAEQLFPEELKQAVKGGLPSSVRFAVPLTTLPAIDSSSVPLLEAGFLRHDLEKLISGLPRKRDQEVLRMRFGLDGSPSRTFSEIGEAFGVGAQRIRQIEARALNHLRRGAKKLAEYLYDD